MVFEHLVCTNFILKHFSCFDLVNCSSYEVGTLVLAVSHEDSNAEGRHLSRQARIRNGRQWLGSTCFEEIVTRLFYLTDHHTGHQQTVTTLSDVTCFLISLSMKQSQVELTGPGTCMTWAILRKKAHLGSNLPRNLDLVPSAKTGAD